MRKIILASALGAALLTTGCFAAGMGTANRVPGFLWAEVKVAGDGYADAGDTKAGMATCKSILGWVALGDCSIEAAKKQGNITKVQYSDVKVKNILGVYAEYTTIVKGQ